MLKSGETLSGTVQIGTEHRGGVAIEWQAEIKLSCSESTGRQRTVGLDAIPVGLLLFRLSISGEEVLCHSNGHRTFLSAGQNHVAVRAAMKERRMICRPVTGIILNLWEDWNLNDMNAGCAHQNYVTKLTGDEPEIGEMCEVCGFRYGYDFLVRPLPDKTVEQIEGLLR
jgi:hypothetical protein